MDSLIAPGDSDGLPLELEVVDVPLPAIELRSPRQFIPLILSLLILIGLGFRLNEGPTLPIARESTRAFLQFQNETALCSFYMRYTNLQLANTWQRFSLTYERKYGGGSVLAEARANLTLRFFKDGQQVGLLNPPIFRLAVSCFSSALSSHPLYFLNETWPYYDELLMNASFVLKSRTFRSVTHTWEYLTASTQKHLSNVKVCFAVAELLFLAIIGLLLRGFQARTWCIEFRLIIFLLLSAALSAAPIGELRSFKSMKFFLLTDTFGKALMEPAVVVYIVVLFHTFAQRNRVIHPGFYPAIFIYFVTSVGLFMVIVATKHDGHWSRIFENIENYWRIVEGSLILRGSWGIWRTVDPPSMAIVAQYTGIVLVAVVGFVMANGITLTSGILFHPSELSATMVLHAFVIAMARMHMPVAPGEERRFVKADSGTGSDGPAISLFPEQASDHSDVGWKG
jgi:hypothetical protein